MHIPDGYLSPSTCAVLYAGAGVGWYEALRRIRHTLNARMVPLISVFAAFSFVLMMFNLPLPGGTTGHALGVTIAAIVIGPAGAILSISIAIAIQALFFGDGGITTLGANCFNMAIIGSLAAYASYRMIAAGAAIGSRRRLVAAAMAGYLATNLAAFITAVEFGIQPLLFRDARGVPLYAPYTLGVAIPAMMIGHLAVAGIAEGALAAGVVAYLQVADPSLLQNTSGLEPASEHPPAPRQPLRKLWITVALLLLLTPLGVLAAGRAWGEWSAAEFSSAEGRSRITASSQRQPAPPNAPTGLQRLSTLWTAPIPDYAPRFVKSPSLGYLLSGMFGVGLVASLSLAVQSYLQRRRSTGQAT
ncbi:MAG TPA: cobalt transporter CbiM [Terriglobales bacterium]|jgi:cobalt/nickel transport system permease protein